MMEFVIMTLSFTVAILLASVLGVLIMMSKPVMKWYMKRVNKLTNVLLSESFVDETEDL